MSGKELLSRLSSWAQATYGVSLRVARLASGFTRADLPTEVVAAMGAIERGDSFRA